MFPRNMSRWLSFDIFNFSMYPVNRIFKMINNRAFLFELLYCAIGAFLFLLGTGWIKLELATKIRRYFSSTQRQINDLQLEIRQHKAEIAGISIV